MARQYKGTIHTVLLNIHSWQIEEKLYILSHKMSILKVGTEGIGKTVYREDR